MIEKISGYYIDRGKESEAANKRIFDQFTAYKEEVEATFGEPLEWQRLEGRRACRIRKRITLGGYRDEDKWPRIHEQMVDAMVRLEKSLRSFIGELDL